MRRIVLRFHTPGIITGASRLWINKRIVSGMRPTGKLHLGHYHGVLANWRQLQEEFECFFFAADWHSLTTEYENTEGIVENTNEMVLDWLAFGIDPKKSTIFLQSRVPQHAELNLILSMITPVSWLETQPHLQGDAGKPFSERPFHFRLSRISGSNGLRHHRLQGDPGAGRA